MITCLHFGHFLFLNLHLTHSKCLHGKLKYSRMHSLQFSHFNLSTWASYSFYKIAIFFTNYSLVEFFTNFSLDSYEIRSTFLGFVTLGFCYIYKDPQFDSFKVSTSSSTSAFNHKSTSFYYSQYSWFHPLSICGFSYCFKFSFSKKPNSITRKKTSLGKWFHILVI